MNDDKQTRFINSRSSDLGGEDTLFADNCWGESLGEPQSYENKVMYRSRKVIVM